jgi:hypothetical protein
MRDREIINAARSYISIHHQSLVLASRFAEARKKDGVLAETIRGEWLENRGRLSKVRNLLAYQTSGIHTYFQVDGFIFHPHNESTIEVISPSELIILSPAPGQYPLVKDPKMKEILDALADQSEEVGEDSLTCWLRAIARQTDMPAQEDKS